MNTSSYNNRFTLFSTVGFEQASIGQIGEVGVTPPGLVVSFEQSQVVSYLVAGYDVILTLGSYPSPGIGGPT